jgi:hypothetical protein
VTWSLLNVYFDRLLFCGSVLDLPVEEQRAASHEAQRRARAFGNRRFCDAFWKVLVFAGIFQEKEKTS